MTRVKFCGLRTAEDAAAASRLMPDFAGFVLSAGFRRSITEEQAAKVREHLAPGIRTVGVFVDEPLERVVRMLRSGLVDCAQLHGAETDAYIEELKSTAGRPVIKFFALRTPADAARAGACPADFVLLDSGTGTGRAFDWTLAQQVKRPFFLAGGLTANNVAEAIRTCRPYAVDVSSGIETGGVKDFSKMAAFMAAVRKEELI